MVEVCRDGQGGQLVHHLISIVKGMVIMVMNIMAKTITMTITMTMTMTMMVIICCC